MKSFSCTWLQIDNIDHTTVCTILNYSMIRLRLVHNGYYCILDTCFYRAPWDNLHKYCSSAVQLHAHDAVICFSLLRLTIAIKSESMQYIVKIIRPSIQ